MVELILVQENVTPNVEMVITKRLKNATSNPVQSGQPGVNRHRAILKVANLQWFGVHHDIKNKTVKVTAR